MAGRKLQARRLRVWSKDPHCAMCGTLTNYPEGFELDHIIRLDQNGQDTEANCQVLCVHWDTQGNKLGCHAAKTRDETRTTSAHGGWRHPQGGGLKPESGR